MRSWYLEVLILLPNCRSPKLNFFFLILAIKIFLALDHKKADKWLGFHSDIGLLICVWVRWMSNAQPNYFLSIVLYISYVTHPQIWKELPLRLECWWYNVTKTPPPIPKWVNELMHCQYFFSFNCMRRFSCKQI